ncbi:MAG TPA: hypothetical protein VI299_16700, partial [Polyangiales bacterium]
SGGAVDATRVLPWLDQGGARRALALRVLVFAPASAALDARLASLYLATHDRALLRVLRPRDDDRLRRVLARDVREGDAQTAALALHAGAPALDALDDPRPSVVIAALRASVRDRSHAARAKRTALREAKLARVAASALTASVLAGDPLETGWLRSRLDGSAWPLRAVASFALAYRNIAAESDAAGDAIARHNLARPVAPSPTNTSFAAAKHFDEPRTLRTEDGLLLVSWPDASGRVDWPALRTTDEVSAWSQDSERK